ncbi:MAG: hypothetical protein LH660_08425 [Phormidesmis sp. CAN_BIN36]|nr:hypothetical protein [Phormidesmis sp. CAN_BIN36]
MNKVLWAASLGATTFVLASCGNNRAANNPPSPTQVAQAPTPAFEKPIAPASSAFLPTVPVKGMIQTTNSKARLSQISTTGQRDPFSAILPASIQLPVQKTAQSPVNPTQVSAKQAIRRLPVRVAPQTITQAPKPLSLRPIAVLPPLPITQIPMTIAQPISRTSLADAVQITGVVQIGGRAVAIIQSPQEGTARYVKPGDYVANGSVLLKRIIISKNGEPTIVLQQNGVEVMKSVGSTGPIASARSL